VVVVVVALSACLATTTAVITLQNRADEIAVSARYNQLALSRLLDGGESDSPGEEAAICGMDWVGTNMKMSTHGQ
jgi:hypothetical protein